MKITEKQLKKLGFEYRDLGNDSPYEMWAKNGIEIWDFNNEYWLVDALDQACIDVEFKTIEELNQFFIACKKDPIIQTSVKNKKAVSRILNNTGKGGLY